MCVFLTGLWKVVANSSSRWFVLWFLCLDLRNRRSSLGFSDVCGNSRGFLHPSAWPAGNYTLRTLRWLAERIERLESEISLEIVLDISLERNWNEAPLNLSLTTTRVIATLHLWYKVLAGIHSITEDFFHKALCFIKSIWATLAYHSHLMSHQMKDHQELQTVVLSNNWKWLMIYINTLFIQGQ